MHELSLLSQIKGCFSGIWIGDAMGMPWETMSHRKILALTEGNGVVGFCDPVQRRIPDTMNLHAGDTTDDWQYATALARSLIRCRGYDQMDCGREFVNEFRRSAFGCGSTTRKAMEELGDFFDSNGTRGRSPLIGAQDNANRKCTNGVAMRIAPLAVSQALKDALRYEPLAILVMNHGAMTHPDVRSSFAAFAIAIVINWVLRDARVYGSINDSDRTVNDFARILRFQVWRYIKWAETRWECQENDEMNLSTILQGLWDEEVMKDAQKVRELFGTSHSALHSIPFALATFFRHPTDFRSGILEAINADGDTDTNAAIVGAMIGANCGVEAIPKEWRNFRPDKQEEACDLAEQLYHVVY
ncbi:MAG: ADP-ribosylglycohydrolase family protein [Candidatus Sungbacteria bacterium]|nr:ADP-ribosylglycohydrolase family protein [bacterium]MDZ4260610.1 ADP-ribosylglycohydrolase family protein [Candidatus Sungbacteria bacterium]